MSINNEIVHLRDETIASIVMSGAALINDRDILPDRNILVQAVENKNDNVGLSVY